MKKTVRTASVRTALTAAMVGVAIIATATTGILGAVFIAENVTADAQKRVTSGLETAASFLEERCGALAAAFGDRATAAERLIAERLIGDRWQLRNRLFPASVYTRGYDQPSYLSVRAVGWGCSTDFQAHFGPSG